MLDRRSFLHRIGLSLATGLIVGDEALALYERLTHRKVWALGGLSEPVAYMMTSRGLVEVRVWRWPVPAMAVDDCIVYANGYAPRVAELDGGA